MRIVIGLCLALVLVAATPTESSAQQPTAIIFTLEIPPPQLVPALALIARIEPIIQKHAPDAEMSAWATTVGGPNTGRIQVITIFPSAEAWGAAGPKVTGDPGYQEIGQSLNALGSEILSVELLSNVIP